MGSAQETPVLADGTQHAQSVFPPAREYLTSAGFAGAAALLAALVIGLAVILAVARASKRRREQQDRHHQQLRDDALRAAALIRCEKRFTWIVDTAGIEPTAPQSATLGLVPELALEMLSGLLRDAQDLGDATLTAAITVYLNQFALVLAQQAGDLSQVVSTPRAHAKAESATNAPKVQSHNESTTPTNETPVAS